MFSIDRIMTGLLGFGQKWSETRNSCRVQIIDTWQFFVTFVRWLSDCFKGLLSDGQRSNKVGVEHQPHIDTLSIWGKLYT